MHPIKRGWSSLSDFLVKVTCSEHHPTCVSPSLELSLSLNFCDSSIFHCLFCHLPVVAMRSSSLAGLASVGLASIATAEDLLFYSTMTDTQEYIQATTVLGMTGRAAPE